MANKKTKVNRVSNILNKDAENSTEKTEVDYTSIIEDYKDSMSGKSMGRPKKEKSKGRVKLTTQINGELIKRAKIKAIELGISLADMLEEALSEHLDK
jgi:predicted HicB family RNase H-like nuclease